MYGCSMRLTIDRSVDRKQSTLAAALDNRIIVSNDRAVTGRFFCDCFARILA